MQKKSGAPQKASLKGRPIEPEQQRPWYQKGRRLLRKRRITISIVSVVLVILIGSGIFVTLFLQNLLNSKNLLAAPPTIQISIDAQALHTLIARALNTSQDSISDVNIVPLANNGLKISLTMVIGGSGINRKLSMEIDATLGTHLQPHKNILTIQHFKRDGIDAGPQTAAIMQATVNLLLEKILPLPGTNNTLDLASMFHFSGSIQQSDSRVCGHGSILLHLGLPVQLPLPTQTDSVLPVSVDSYIGLDQKNNLQFHLDSITYGNGNGFGALGTNVARKFINQMLTKSSSSLNADSYINQMKLLSLSTSSQFVCGKSTEMLVLQLGPGPGK